MTAPQDPDAPSRDALERACPDLVPVADPVPEGHAFALCLTHDVDRPYKSVQGLYYALRERPGYHLRTSLPDRNPYWQFETLMDLEDDLGVRSAFYFLDQPHLLRKGPRALGDPRQWVEQIGRYDVADPAIRDVLGRLDDGGWEVGLHGPFGTAEDPELLARGKRRIEAQLGHGILGGRQHYLRLTVPDTWRHYRDVGLRYDASYGARETWGFDHGDRPFRPFGDDFVVFPLALMDQALPDPGRRPAAAREAVRSFVSEAAARGAVATVLWHPRLFNETEFPGFAGVYELLVRRALAADGWVGSPAALRRAWASEPADRPTASTE
ncbi:MAG: polysaccharide deacetylase family protein [Haloferacaceae archaeon]